MKFISSMRAERSIAQFLGESDVDAPAARKAAESLRKLGGNAVPNVIDALATADKNQSMVLIETLGSQLNDTTFRQFAAGLGHSDQRCVSGVASALSVGTTYNANKLIELLGDEGISKPALIEIMRSKKSRLNMGQLLSRSYDLEPREKAALFKIIDSAATDATVPQLLARTQGKDYAVRVHIINILARFSRPDVVHALVEQLGDPHKSIRQAAIGALARMDGHFDINIERICQLLLDPDMDVQNKTVDLLIKLHHPETMQHLVAVLKDESEYARRSAVEVLNEIAEPSTIKHLLTAIEDEDWWVRSRASDALAAIGGPKVMNAVLELIGDENENVRRSAIEILNQTKDERAVKHLMQAVNDDDWWVSERAADALGEIGDRQAVPALIPMLQGDVRSIPAAVRALGNIGGDKIATQVLPMLKHKEKAVRIEAVSALAKLADQTMATQIKQQLQPLMSGADDTIAKLAADAMVRIDNRFSTTAVQADEIANRFAEPAHTLLIEEAQVDEIAQTALLSGTHLDITTLKAGDVIEGRYKYIDKIGKGAFGTVVLVEDTIVDERLILKFLNANVSSDEEMLQRFVHELRYSRKITHKNVIRIYDFVSLGGLYAISMEYFPSHTLGAEIARQKPMPTDKTIGWTKDIATGMAVAHQVGIVHRDLKPANILIDDDGLLKIVDFGVAAAASSGDTQLTKTGYVIGSPKYMAPEQILGKKVDVRADIYSLGVLAYEMLTGTPPYTKGDHMSVMYQHVQGKAPLCEELNPDIPPVLAAIVKKAMEVDKLKRYSSMDDMRQALIDVA
ncbi:MAG: serine/threonine protein kinase [Chromatiales bacterium]|jgi:serine/threonine-protein kinase|nr:serine/threonine protein kinase [Chromatiales bacterium]